MPTIIDKREGQWIVEIRSGACPYLTYPRSDIACDLLENKQDDSYCYFENCPIKTGLGLCPICQWKLVGTKNAEDEYILKCSKPECDYER